MTSAQSDYWGQVIKETAYILVYKMFKKHGLVQSRNKSESVEQTAELLPGHCHIRCVLRTKLIIGE